MRYLWDTNVAIYFLQEQFIPKAAAVIDAVLKDSGPVISVITEIELMCWKSAEEKDVIILKRFIADAAVLELESEVKIKTAEIRKTHRIKLPDAIIAATAITHSLTLVTNNTSDFKGIKNLMLLDPYS